MRKTLFVILAAIFASAVWLQLPAWSATSAALTGVVTSEAEPHMEGVVVSAKAVGGKVTVSVISDHDGRYSFPADRLAPGSYELRIRAIGYDAANSQLVATVKKGKHGHCGHQARQDAGPVRAAELHGMVDEHSRNAGAETKAIRRVHDVPRPDADSQKHL